MPVELKQLIHPNKPVRGLAATEDVDMRVDQTGQNRLNDANTVFRGLCKEPRLIIPPGCAEPEKT